MPNILEDLYYGNISPCQRAVRPGSKTQKLMQKQSDLETKLSESLTEEQREIFEQYLSVSADLLDANCLDSFITGFRLGAILLTIPFAADSLKSESAARKNKIVYT